MALQPAGSDDRPSDDVVGKACSASGRTGGHQRELSLGVWIRISSVVCEIFSPRSLRASTPFVAHGVRDPIKGPGVVVSVQFEISA